MITGAFVLIVIVLSAESLTRLKGFTPLIPAPLFISLTPPGNYFTRHPTRGYGYVPGDFKVTESGPHSFHVTHLNNGLRETHSVNGTVPDNKKQLWIFGCSFTHGWGLNDEETYPWLLQQEFTDYEVVNFGVDGYGTVQSLIQFQESLKAGNKPAIVVVAYAALHDQRNGLTRVWKKSLLTNSRLGPMNYPYAMLGPNRKLVFLNDPMEYPGLGLMRHSALANYLDDQMNVLIEGSYHSHEVSRAVLDEFWNLCKSNGIEFVLAGIINDPLTAEMLESFAAKGAMTINISVDLSIKENTNLPYDAHPSASANKQYAEKLGAFLAARFNRQSQVGSKQ